MIQITDKKKCTGCTSCFNICPQNCISMTDDSEGFVYPNLLKEQCLDCGLCEKVCPMNKDGEAIEVSQTFYFQSNNEEDRKYSTSGALFSALARKYLTESNSVYGVLYDDEMNVVHSKAKDSNDISKMRMSNYVQSDMNEVMQSIKIDLTQNRKVLFVGTPCQVAGVHEYVSLVAPKYMENLLLIDLECYGVPSPKLYRKWIDYLNQKYHSAVNNIFFRDKKYGYSGVNIKVCFENGKCLEDHLDAKLFTRTMFSGIGLRPSCYECGYRNRKKVSDLTLGDGWSVDKEFPDMDDEKGTT